MSILPHIHNIPQILDKFIVLEGIDGAGKSTQLDLLAVRLKAQHISTATTREPHSGVIGSHIRTVLQEQLPVLQSPFDAHMTSTVLAYLFAADRHEHVYAHNGMLALLENHDLVLCDRYMFSSIAYQNAQVAKGTRAVPAENTKRETLDFAATTFPQKQEDSSVLLDDNNLAYVLNRHFPLPKLLIYFDIDPATAMQRMGDKKKDGLETLENLTNVHTRYKALLDIYRKDVPDMHILIVNAQDEPDAISRHIMDYIFTYIR